VVVLVWPGRIANFQELTARVDHSFSKKHLMAVRYFYDRFRETLFSIPTISHLFGCLDYPSQNLLVHIDVYLSAYSDNYFRFTSRQRRPNVDRRKRDQCPGFGSKYSVSAYPKRFSRFSEWRFQFW